MKVQFFAVLKDYFGSEIELEASDINDLMNQLKNNKEEAVSILNTSKVVINNEIITGNVKLDEIEMVILLPPSSGG